MSQKWIALLLALILALSVCGCAADKPQTETAETTAAVETRTAAGQSTVTDEELTQTAQWLMEQIPQPTYGSVGGEWAVFGLARSGVSVPKEYFEVYGENVAAYTAEHGGVLHAKKYTEYSRVILAWTALGKDATDVGGFNLLVPLADFDQTVFQGINGPIFALLALDSGAYDIPENTAGTTQATRDGYVDYILNAELPGGGWSFAGGDAETDITAMALQARAPYRASHAEAIERALDFLSAAQTARGDYDTGAESCAQVILALCALGLDPRTEPRFVKAGGSVYDGLLLYRTQSGAFCHTLDTAAQPLSTQQAALALLAVERGGSVYDLTGVSVEPYAYRENRSVQPRRTVYYLLGGAAAVLLLAGGLLLWKRKTSTRE